MFLLKQSALCKLHYSVDEVLGCSSMFVERGTDNMVIQPAPRCLIAQSCDRHTIHYHELAASGFCKQATFGSMLSLSQLDMTLPN